MPNRSERRAGAEAPTPAAVAIERTQTAQSAPSAPLRVFGATGEPVTIAGREFTTAVLTSAGAMDVQRYITRMEGIDAETVGEQLVGFALFVQNLAGVRGLLDKLIAEPLPAQIEEAAAPSDLIEAINVAFTQTGLSWLERIVKNSASQAGKAIEREIARLVETGITERLAQLPAALTETDSTGTASAFPSTTS